MSLTNFNAYGVQRDGDRYFLVSNTIPVVRHEITSQINSAFVTTISSVRLLTGILPSNILYTNDIGQEGVWRYDATDTTSTDNLGTILVTSDGKRIKRIFSPDQVNVKWFGAIGDGVYDNVVAFQSCVDFCLVNNYKMYIPSGTYILNVFTTVGRAIYISNWTAEYQGLYMYGDGIGKTIIKEADGATERGGRFTRMFYCYMGTSPVVKRRGSYIIKDISFDKNGRSNSAPPTLFAWEQAHIITFAGSGASVFPLVKLENVEFIDKIGAGLNMSSSIGAGLDLVVVDTVLSINNPNVVTPHNPTAKFGQRGCLEFGMPSLETSILNANIMYSQIEPTVASTIDNPRTYSVSNSRIIYFEFTDNSYYSFAKISNMTSLDGFLVRGLACQVDNSVIKPLGNITSRDLKITNTTLLIPYDTTTNVISPFTFGSVSGTTGENILKVSNSSIVIDSDDTVITPTGYLVSGGSGDMVAYTMSRSFVNVSFDPRCANGVLAYYNGKWRFTGCSFGSKGNFINVGGFSSLPSAYSDVSIISCDVTDVLGQIILISNNGSNYKINIFGNYLASKMFSVSGSSIDPSTVITCNQLIGSAITANYIPKGLIIRNTAYPENTNIYGWAKKLSGGSAATVNWEIITIPITIIDTTTVPYTKATLNAAYPTAVKDNVVIQDGANMTYKKKDNSATGNWSTFPTVQLT